MLREISTIFLKQKWLQLLRYSTKSVQERKKWRTSTVTKPFNGRSWFQAVHSTKKSTSCCSRQLSQRTKFVASSSIYFVQKTWRCNWSLFTRWLMLWIAQTERFVKHCCATRQITQRPPMLKFVYSEEEGGRKISTNCVCQLKTWRIGLSSWRHEFSVWLLNC